MFPPTDKPRLFGLPCGTNFSHGVRDGLLAHFGTDGPDVLARTEIFVNTARMKRTLLAAFDDGTTRLLPRVRLITELGRDPQFHEFPNAVSPLRLRLELAKLISAFLEREPEFADRVSVHGLADSLARLLGEMHDEGVSYEDLCALDVRDVSTHWAKALEFIGLIKRFYDCADERPAVSEARLATVVEHLAKTWKIEPPQTPKLVVGSTGSRGTTARFMELVSRLPQGALVFPGVDFDMPQEVWSRIQSDDIRDHPQERIIRMAHRLGLSQGDVTPFAPIAPPCPARNALLSLALRPAPVTDQWMRDGPKLPNIAGACRELTLIEAPDPRTEAVSVALTLRDAAERGERAALITPDRDLARQVTAALDRWSIDPEDSAGIPLNQTPSGRLFRHLASTAVRGLTPTNLLVILKHPLVARGQPLAEFGEGVGRGPHLLHTRGLELFLRRNQPTTITKDILDRWADAPQATDERAARRHWANWISASLIDLDGQREITLQMHIDRLVEAGSALARGPWSRDERVLWSGHDGRTMLRMIERLSQEAEIGGSMTAYEFEDFFRTLIGRELSRDPTPRHPDILIWGTLEARAVDADLVVLGGLNEGVWPAHPPVDPWFNRELRNQANLLSPDQMVGLSAHDFEQAFCARTVILSRSIRDAEADTIPSRWLVRVLNLLEGSSDESRAARADMIKRGNAWIELARALDHFDRLPEPLPPAPRPSPVPPLYAQPKEMPVTAIERLVRDPYDVYANRILGLRKLSPLEFSGEPRDRGNVLHTMMEIFISSPTNIDPKAAQKRLLDAAQEAFEHHGIPALFRTIWMAHIEHIAASLALAETERASKASAVFAERKGGLKLSELNFEVTAKADRIDCLKDGTFHIYDYKSSAPSAKQIGVFNLQLLFEAVILADGAFDEVGQGATSAITYLGLDKALKTSGRTIAPTEFSEIREKLVKLLGRHLSRRVGYTAKRAVFKETFSSDFEQLSRFGEWDLSDAPMREDLE